MAENNKFSKEFASIIWDKRLEGLPVPELDLLREITPQELENLHLKFAFVHILDPETTEPDTEIQIIESQSGWTILDYGSAMGASPGKMLFDHGEFVRKEDGDLERVCTGTGTTTLQIIHTAEDMVRIAKEKHHWKSIHTVAGHELMKWGIWKAAQDLGMLNTGYKPSKYDEAKYQRIQKDCPALLLQTTISPKR